MIFVLDECAPRLIADRLRERGHTVVSVAQSNMGAGDDVVLRDANNEDAILITCDKDFGRMVFSHGQATAGVILVRLEGLAHQTKADLVATVIDEHGADLLGVFTVISPGMVRVRQTP